MLEPDNEDKALIKVMLSIDIEELLQSTGHDFLMKHLGVVADNMRDKVAIARRRYSNYHEIREIREEIGYDMEEMNGLLRTALHGEGSNQNGKLTPSQYEVFSSVKEAVDEKNQQKLFFLMARGGTGKTFLLNRLLYYVRTLDSNSIALSVAFT